MCFLNEKQIFTHNFVYFPENREYRHFNYNFEYD